MKIRGSFEVQMQPEPPFDSADGVVLGRMRVDNTFSGPLTAKSKVEMLSVRTPIADSAGYVAIERITGTLDGKSGSFSVVHLGLSRRGEKSLTIEIVPDSGTGDLRGIGGEMSIDVVDGRHDYELSYALDAAD